MKNLLIIYLFLWLVVLCFCNQIFSKPFWGIFSVAFSGVFFFKGKILIKIISKRISIICRIEKKFHADIPAKKLKKDMKRHELEVSRNLV